MPNEMNMIVSAFVLCHLIRDSDNTKTKASLVKELGNEYSINPIFDSTNFK